MMSASSDGLMVAFATGERNPLGRSPSSRATRSAPDAGPDNDPPDAVDDVLATAVNTPVTVPVLENDSDPDQDPLTVTVALGPAHGTVTVNDSGSITYTPAWGFHGTETFVYRLDDGAGGSDSATVIVTVPEPARADLPGDDLDAALAVTLASGQQFVTRQVI